MNVCSMVRFSLMVVLTQSFASACASSSSTSSVAADAGLPAVDATAPLVKVSAKFSLSEGVVVRSLSCDAVSYLQLAGTSMAYLSACDDPTVKEVHLELHQQGYGAHDCASGPAFDKVFIAKKDGTSLQSGLASPLPPCQLVWNRDVPAAGAMTVEVKEVSLSAKADDSNPIVMRGTAVLQWP